jgi:hypothetical protein
VAITKVVAHLNLVIPYKMELEELTVWSREIDRLSSADELAKLPFLIDCFKTDAIIWDKNLGIQNIFRGFKQVEKTEEGFKVLRAIW